ncbi:MAG: hypothetical protein ABEJ40_08615 [Haloarculaceae archaeon]
MATPPSVRASADGRSAVSSSSASSAPASAASVAAAVVLGGAVALAGTPGRVGFVLVAFVALAAVGFDATRFRRGTDSPAVVPAEAPIVLLQSTAVLVAAATVTGVAGALVWYRAFARAGAALAATADSTFVSLVVLQVEAVLVAFALRVALPVVDDWTGGTGAPVSGSVEWLSNARPAIADVPRRYWALFALQALLAVRYPNALDEALSALPGVGAPLSAVLDGRYLHLPLEALLALLGAIVALEGVRMALARWAAPDPPRTVARAAGGLAASTLVVLAGLVPPTAGAMARAVPTEGPLHTVAAVCGVLTVETAFLFGVLVAVWYCASNPVVPDRASGFAVGAALLFACAVAAGPASVAPPVAFGVAAAAFVVWDVGATATQLGTTLGDRAETVRGEFVGAATTVLVGGVGVALATGALYLLGPLSASVPPWRGYLALTLALVALFAFALYLVQSSPASH